jgi:hypothetical protein
VTANNRLTREFAHLLTHHAMKVRVLNGCNLMDEAVGTEAWAREAAEILLRRRFSCSNILSAQQDTFDIHGGKTIIQVTSNLRVDKVQHTLETYEKNGHHSTYPRLLVFLIGEKPVYKQGDFSKLKLGFHFSPAKQIVGIKELVRAATRLRLDELRKLLDVTRAYLGNETPALSGIEHLHEQCKDFQRELESCRTAVQKAIKKMNTFAILHPPSAAKLPVVLKGLEKFESVIQSWSDMARTAAMTSGQAGRAKVEEVSRVITGQHLSLIGSRAQFERMAESIMEEAEIHRMFTRRESQKELIGTLEEELQRAELEVGSAEFALKFLSGI